MCICKPNKSGEESSQKIKKVNKYNVIIYIKKQTWKNIAYA